MSCCNILGNNYSQSCYLFYFIITFLVFLLHTSGNRCSLYARVREGFIYDFGEISRALKTTAEYIQVPYTYTLEKNRRREMFGDNRRDFSPFAFVFVFAE